MKQKSLNQQTNKIMKGIKSFPVSIMEIKITQSILSSKMNEMSKGSLEKLINTLVFTVRYTLGKSYDDLDVMAYRVDLTASDILTFDYIQHRLILIGNGMEDKLSYLKESIGSFVKNKMGDTCSVYFRENQTSDEVYTYLKNQPENNSNRSEFETDKMKRFYHSDLYDNAEKGWIIFHPNQLKNSFVTL